LFLAQLGASTIIGDLSMPETIHKIVNGTDVILSLAMPPFLRRLNAKKIQSSTRQHYVHTKNIFEAMTREDERPIILTEGIMLYGDSGDSWIDETSKFNPIGFARLGEFATPYIQKMMEKKAPIIRMQLGCVYGAGSWFKETVYRLIKKGCFHVHGGGPNVLSYVHVDDVAEAYRLAVEKLPVGESFIIVDDEPCKSINFANFTAKYMRKPPIKIMPKWIDEIFAGSIVSEALTVNCKARNTKAKKLLDWHLKYPSWRDGIPVVIEEIERSV